MPYSNALTIAKALYFDLFDDIKYEWLKEVLDPEVDKEEEYIDIEIEDLPEETRGNHRTTSFTFELRKVDYIRMGETHYKTKKFVVEKSYNGASPFGITLAQEWEDDEEDNEEDEYESEDDHSHCCPNLHWGGQYGCDLCSDLKDSKNPEMKAEWLDKNKKYSYKLHKMWVLQKWEKEKAERAERAANPDQENEDDAVL
jgi:hypothetical protein